jgi:hypothetical protein
MGAIKPESSLGARNLIPLADEDERSRQGDHDDSGSPNQAPQKVA